MTVTSVATPEVGDRSSAPAPLRRRSGHRWLRHVSSRRADLLGLSLVIGAAVIVLLPALLHGASFGPFDNLEQFGLTKVRDTIIGHPGTSDQIQLNVPWTALAWREVHHGHLPLWNPYSALGMPLVFNWQSGAFSLPSLFGYLVPMQYAVTAAMFAKLFLAGSGAYVLCRVLGLSVPAAVLGGTAFELSGSMIGWLGWSMTSVTMWLGWLLAAAVLVMRGRHRAWCVTMLAAAVAGIIYGGFPEGVAITAFAFAAFLVGWLVAAAVRRQFPGWRGILDLALGGAAGVALGAPLLLPGAQLASSSARNVPGLSAAISPHYLLHVLFQGYEGMPLPGQTWFGTDFFEADMYVGVIVVVLAVLAVVAGWRRPAVIALCAVVVIAVALIFFQPIYPYLQRLPTVGTVFWNRATMVLDFALAVLAAIGAEAVIRESRRTAVRRTLLLGFAVAAGLLAVLAVDLFTLNQEQYRLRAGSFIWPGIATVAGLALAGWLQHSGSARAVAPTGARRPPASAVGRSATAAGLVVVTGLLVVETVCLVAAGGAITPSSRTWFPQTPAVAQLQRTVGTATVGADCNHGIQPDANVAYGVHESGVYDAILPKRYYSAWYHATGQQPVWGSLFGILCFPVLSANDARHFGISYALVARGAPGPAGAVFVAHVGDEDLYRIPHSSAATWQPLADHGAPVPLEVRYPGPASWSVTYHGSTTGVVRFRLTNVPGWHATIDGKPLPLRSWGEVMQEAEVPPGRHVIELHYWPRAFTVGLVLAAAAALGLAAWLLAAPLWSAWRRTSGRRAAPRRVRPGSAPPAP